MHLSINLVPTNVPGEQFFSKNHKRPGEWQYHEFQTKVCQAFLPNIPEDLLQPNSVHCHHRRWWKQSKIKYDILGKLQAPYVRRTMVAYSVKNSNSLYQSHTSYSLRVLTRHSTLRHVKYLPPINLLGVPRPIGPPPSFCAPCCSGRYHKLCR